MRSPGAYEIEITEDGIRAQAAFRLPFDRLTTSQRAFRSALASAIRELDGDNPLACIYSSGERSTSDIENVLVYNVGTPAFRQTRTLTVERRYESQPPPYLHLYQYLTAGRAKPAGRHLSGFEFKPKVEDLRSVTRTWLLARTTVPIGLERHDGAFTLDVRIFARDTIRVATLIKPLLDGIVSALHEYRGAALDIVVPLVARHARAPIDHIAAALSRPTGLLGPREVVRAYRSGIKWDPADDRCSWARVSVEQADDPRVEVRVGAADGP